MEGQMTLFEDMEVQSLIDSLYSHLIWEKKIDLVHKDKDRSKEWETIDLNSIKNKDVSETGSEWMTYQAIKELGIKSHLTSRGWDCDKVNLAVSHLMSRAVYPVSELKTVSFIRENSSVCELTDYPVELINRVKLYGISKSLYEEKSGLESHLSHRTNELFDIKDTIIYV